MEYHKLCQSLRSIGLSLYMRRCPVDFFVLSAFFCPLLKTPKPQASVSRGVSFSSLVYATCPMSTTCSWGKVLVSLKPIAKHSLVIT